MMIEEFFAGITKIFTDFTSAMYTLLFVITVVIIILAIVILSRPTEGDSFERRLREDRLLREEDERQRRLMREREEREEREKKEKAEKEKKEKEGK